MSREVAPSAAYLRALRDERMRLAAMRERVLRLPESERRAEILARIDATLKELEVEIRTAERRRGWRIAPREHLKLVRIDREMGALSLQLAATHRRSFPERRRRSRRVVRRVRARSPGREPDDPEPALGRLQAPAVLA